MFTGTSAGWAIALFIGLGPATSPQLSFHEVWMRPARTAGGTSAAYLRIENAGPAAVTIVRVASPAATTVEVHRMRHETDIMRMEMVERLTIPARQAVTLAPGGLHLMVIGVTRPLQPGARVTLRFTLDGGAIVGTQATVRAEGAGR